MKLLFITILTAFTALGAASQKVINDPNVEPRTVGSFTRLEVSQAFNVVLTQGNEESVAVSSNVEGDNKNITTRVENGTLKISYKQDGKRWYKNQQLRAYVSAKTLEAITGTGASKISIEGTLAAPQLSIRLTGATDLKGKLAVRDNLRLELKGASDATLTGAAGMLHIEAAGASDLKAFELTTANCQIEASGACSIRISAEKEISADLSGASSVQYQGSALIRNIKTTGASSISKKS